MNMWNTKGYTSLHSNLFFFSSKLFMLHSGDFYYMFYHDALYRIWLWDTYNKSKDKIGR